MCMKVTSSMTNTRQLTMMRVYYMPITITYNFMKKTIKFAVNKLDFDMNFGDLIIVALSNNALLDQL